MTAPEKQPPPRPLQRLQPIQPERLHPGLTALMSTRPGGVSTGDFAGLNLRPVHYGPTARADAPGCIARNHALWQERVGAPVRYLQQVHGTRVVRWTGDEPLPAFDAPQDSRPQADAAITTRAGVVCTVLVADCLPVLLWVQSALGQTVGVGAAHAGWRGLAGGVLEATVSALRQALDSAPDRAPDTGGLTWHAWLGAGIGPTAFEVGGEVRDAFTRGDPASAAHFLPSPDRPDHHLASLTGLARLRLQRLGVHSVQTATDARGATACTHGDAARFYSFRRDGGITGRMAASVCFWPPGSEDTRPAENP